MRWDLDDKGFSPLKALPVPSGTGTNKDDICFGDDSLDEDLLLVTLTKRSCNTNKQTNQQIHETQTPSRKEEEEGVGGCNSPMELTGWKREWAPSKESTLKEAMGVEPGWVEMRPLNLVTVQVRTWFSEHTEEKEKDRHRHSSTRWN